MRRRIQSPKDEAWIDKQIVALTNQGYTTREIMNRYHIHDTRVARVRREAGIILKDKKNLQEDNHCIDGFAIPEMETLLTARPRHSANFSQVIWR